MTPFEIFNARYSHLFVCSPSHPLFEKYHKEFKVIDYKQDYDVWKPQFYKYYLNTDDPSIIKNIVENYLESLVFNLKYYFKGCPSWQYHYKFRVPPLFSDVYQLLDNKTININEINFEIGKPYTPFQQLMMILPPQMNGLLPSPLRKIMTDDKLLCTQFYPTDCKLDATVGIKTQYSEAILPEIDEDFLISVVKKHEEELNGNEKVRNTIKLKPYKIV
jgi:5'-3' exonuclease